MAVRGILQTDSGEAEIRNTNANTSSALKGDYKRPGGFHTRLIPVCSKNPLQCITMCPR